MNDFEYLEPASTEEAIDLLQTFGTDAQVLAGGTDLVINLLRGAVPRKYLISITSIPDLSLIEQNGDLHIGASATFDQVDKSRHVRASCEMLSEATGIAGSQQIRNLGTIGGNICNAVPSADSAAPLLAGDAIVVIASSKGNRQVPLAQFFRGPRQTMLEPDEMVLKFVLPHRPPHTGSTYSRFSTRRALDLAVVGVAVSVTVDPFTEIIREARLALGAVTPTPRCVTEAEQLLNGSILTDELLCEVAESAVRSSKPRSSIRGSAKYKQDIIRVLTKRCVREATRRAMAGSVASVYE